MRITTEQLNQVAELLGTNDKNVIFSAIIKTLVESGVSVKEAFDSVFGEGAYLNTAGQIYDAIK